MFQLQLWRSSSVTTFTFCNFFSILHVNAQKCYQLNAYFYFYILFGIRTTSPITNNVEVNILIPKKLREIKFHSCAINNPLTTTVTHTNTTWWYTMQDMSKLPIVNSCIIYFRTKDTCRSELAS